MSSKSLYKKKTNNILDESKLYKSALSYLSKYSSSSENLRKVLTNKATKYYFNDNENYIQIIDNIITKLNKNNVLNDHLYSESRALKLLRNGNPTIKIIQDLKNKGVDINLIKKTIIFLKNNHEEYDNIDLLAAYNYLKKRKILISNDKQNNNKKNLAKMARAGFDYKIVKQALNIENIFDDHFD